MSSPASGGHVPEFMRRFAEFDRERRRLRTVDDWMAFSARWFDPAGWPRKRPEQLGAEATARREVVELEGRRWSHVAYAHDLAPAARYEYLATLHGIGDARRFPHLRHRRGGIGQRWTQECPFCALWTADLGDEACPRCGRPLVWVLAED